MAQDIGRCQLILDRQAIRTIYSNDCSACAWTIWLAEGTQRSAELSNIFDVVSGYSVNTISKDHWHYQPDASENTAKTHGFGGFGNFGDNKDFSQLLIVLL